MQINQTIELVKFIGSPFLPGAEAVDGDTKELYAYAIRNRIPFFYLGALKRQDKLGELREEYDIRQKRYLRMLDAMVKISDFLDSINVESAIFKTIKPYPAVCNDVDVICLGSDKDYEKIIEAMLRAGYEKAPPPSVSPRQTKLVHSVEGHVIDLHKNIGISGIVYMDKKRLNKYKTKVKLTSGSRVNALTPQADLAIVMLHSIVSEQLYTLADYYTTVYNLTRMDAKGIDNFINTVKENHLTFVARIYLSLTSTLHQTVFGEIHEKLSSMLGRLGGTDKTETKRLVENEFKVPHKYLFITVIKALLEKMKERETRKSIWPQIRYSLNPKNALFLAKATWHHRTRETQEEVHW